MEHLGFRFGSKVCPSLTCEEGDQENYRFADYLKAFKISGMKLLAL
jgi:hypothetical protein